MNEAQRSERRVDRLVGRRHANKKRLWSNDDLHYALTCAADFLEMEEWPENDGGVQVAAYKEAAKRIRRMAKRVPPN